MDIWGSYKNYLKTVDVNIKSEIDIKTEPIGSEGNYPYNEHDLNCSALKQEDEEQNPILDYINIQESKIEENVSFSEDHENFDELAKIEQSNYPIVLVSKLKSNLMNKQTFDVKDLLMTKNRGPKSLQKSSFDENVINENSSSEALEQKWKCGHCPYRAWNKRTLQSHLLHHIGVKMFKCDVCTYESLFKEHLKNHVLTHYSEKVFKCAQCNFETNLHRYLLRHLSKHHSGMRFSCSDCSFITNDKETLKAHVLNHLSGKLFKCDDCTYATNDRHNIKRHFLKHSNQKLFKCPKCDYETNYRYHLRRHLAGKGHKKPD